MPRRKRQSYQYLQKPFKKPRMEFTISASKLPSLSIAQSISPFGNHDESVQVFSLQEESDKINYQNRFRTESVSSIESLDLEQLICDNNNNRLSSNNLRYSLYECDEGDEYKDQNIKCDDGDEYKYQNIHDEGDEGDEGDVKKKYQNIHDEGDEGDVNKYRHYKNQYHNEKRKNRKLENIIHDLGGSTRRLKKDRTSYHLQKKDKKTKITVITNHWFRNNDDNMNDFLFDLYKQNNPFRELCWADFAKEYHKSLIITKKNLQSHIRQAILWADKYITVSQGEGIRLLNEYTNQEYDTIDGRSIMQKRKVRKTILGLPVFSGHSYYHTKLGAEAYFRNRPEISTCYLYQPNVETLYRPESIYTEKDGIRTKTELFVFDKDGSKTPFIDDGIWHQTTDIPYCLTRYKPLETLKFSLSINCFSKGSLLFY